MPVISKPRKAPPLVSRALCAHPSVRITVLRRLSRFSLPPEGSRY
nr:MAG TPA: hypothetical protein [Caudoviricetes sp.]